MSKLIADRNFWATVWAVVVAILAHTPVARAALAGVATKLNAWGQRRAPGWAWAIAHAEAETAVRAAWQRGEAYNWGGQQKMDSAVTWVQSVLEAHGVPKRKMPSAKAIEGLLESTWNQVKGTFAGVTPAAAPAAPNPVAALIGVAAPSNSNTASGVAAASS